MRDRKRFSQQLMQLYLQTPFDVPFFSCKVGDKIFLSYAGKEQNIRRKKFITDFDGVFEAENTLPLYKLFYNHLHDRDINPDIETDKIYSFIQSIFLGIPIMEVFAQMKDYLKSKNLTHDQYIRACERAAGEWKESDEAWETVNEIRRLHYSIAILSGSPQEAIEMVRKRIDVQRHEIFGTRFEFDESGLKEIHPMLCEKKLEKKKELIGDEPHIAVTDDLQTDYMITAGADLSVIVADNDEAILRNERQLYVFDKLVRKDFHILSDYIKKFEYAFVRSFEATQESEKEIIVFVKMLKEAKNKSEFLFALKYLRLELEDFDLFLYRERIITEYENTGDEATQKRLKELILSMLKQLPEFVDIEAFDNVVKNDFA